MSPLPDTLIHLFPSYARAFARGLVFVAFSASAAMSHAAAAPEPENAPAHGAETSAEAPTVEASGPAFHPSIRMLDTSHQADGENYLLRIDLTDDLPQDVWVSEANVQWVTPGAGGVRLLLPYVDETTLATRVRGPLDPGTHRLLINLILVDEEGKIAGLLEQEAELEVPSLQLFPATIKRMDVTAHDFHADEEGEIAEAVGPGLFFPVIGGILFGGAFAFFILLALEMAGMPVMKLAVARVEPAMRTLKEKLPMLERVESVVASKLPPALRRKQPVAEKTPAPRFAKPASAVFKRSEASEAREQIERLQRQDTELKLPDEFPEDASEGTVDDAMGVDEREERQIEVEEKPTDASEANEPEIAAEESEARAHAAAGVGAAVAAGAIETADETANEEEAGRESERLEEESGAMFGASEVQDESEESLEPVPAENMKSAAAVSPAETPEDAPETSSQAESTVLAEAEATTSEFASEEPTVVAAEQESTKTKLRHDAKTVASEKTIQLDDDELAGLEDLDNEETIEAVSKMVDEAAHLSKEVEIENLREGGQDEFDTLDF